MFHRNDPFQTLFQELVNRSFEAGRPVTEPREAPQNAPWTPAIDAFVDGDKFILQVMLAGVDPASVELTATGNRLTIKGGRERKAPKDARSLHVREVPYGPFERTLELPEGTDAGKAEARFEHGVLSVTLPAVGAFVPRKITIQNGTTRNGGGDSLHAA